MQNFPFVENSKKFEAFMKTLSKVPNNFIKTDIKQVEYDFSGSFEYNIDAYDYFNRFIPLNYCPYIRIGKYHKVLGKGVLPKIPIVVKAKFFSREAEQRIKSAGGACVLSA